MRRAIPVGIAVLAFLSSACSGGSTAAPSTGTGAIAATPFSSVAAPTSTGLHPKGETVSGLKVVWVTDGDTFKVMLDGRETTVRMIGMNTPETVKENTPVECYGPEASDYAKKMLKGQRVTLEFDPSQGRTDQYGRTLAYAWLEQPNGQLSFVNLDEISLGLARERQYGPTPYAWKSTFKDAQKKAKAAGAGLWGACPL